MDHESFWSVLTDPNHIGAELVWTLVFDVFLAGTIWPLIKRAVRRHDRKRHGLEDR